MEACPYKEVIHKSFIVDDWETVVAGYYIRHHNNAFLWKRHGLTIQVMNPELYKCLTWSWLMVWKLTGKEYWTKVFLSHHVLAGFWSCPIHGVPEGCRIHLKGVHRCLFSSLIILFGQAPFKEGWASPSFIKTGASKFLLILFRSIKIPSYSSSTGICAVGLCCSVSFCERFACLKMYCIYWIITKCKSNFYMWGVQVRLYR